MTLSNADRQRRFRRHRAGDHSLCDPKRQCGQIKSVTPAPAVTPAPKPPPEPDPVDDLDDLPLAERELGEGGRLLWKQLDGAKLTGGPRALAREACRIVDRLDKLDRMLGGEAHDWIRLVEQAGKDDIVEVVIDKPLAEARQQAAVLKQLVAELRQGSDAGAKVPEQGGEYGDQLAARRAKRLADATGR